MILYLLYLCFGIFSAIQYWRRGIRSYPNFILACSVIFLGNILSIWLLLSILSLALMQLPVMTTSLLVMAYVYDIVTIGLLLLVSQKVMRRMQGSFTKR